MDPELLKVKLFLSGQIKIMKEKIFLDKKASDDQRLDVKQKEEIIASLKLLTQDRSNLIKKMKKIEIDLLLLQAKKSLEEIKESNGYIDKVLTESKKKIITFASLPTVVRKRKRRKNNN